MLQMPKSQSPLVSDDEDLVLIDNDQISNYNADNILPVSPDTLAKLRAWLDPTKYNLDSGEYRKHLASRMAGTGTWLPSLKNYQQWHNSSEDGLLWIKGIPGSGKSVLAASLVQKLAAEGVPVLFFFFRQIIDANHRPVNLLRDWLDQVLVYSPPLQIILKGYVESGRSLETVSIEDLWAHLRTALAQIPLVYCVADALDEMDQRNDEFIRCLADLGHWRPSQVKVMITSRPVATVEDPMRRITYGEIRMDERFVDVDIATYVRHTLERSSISKADRVLIKKAVPGRANGLFLYAKLAMDSFLEPDADITATLHKLPLDLNDMYSSILKEHARRSGIPESDQLRILQWVTHAIRPLRLLELADLIKTTTIDKSQLTLKANKDLVRAACGPLLEILPDETISVVHHSLTEFLLGTTRSQSPAGFPILQLESTHSQLAIACLTYLSHGCLQIDGYMPRTQPEDAMEAQNLQFPFVLYACTYWHQHAARCNWPSVSDPLFTHIDRFLSNRALRYQWLELFWEDWMDSESSNYDERTDQASDLHIAACFGLAEYLSMVIKRDGSANIEAEDASGITPLMRAVFGGHASCARVLLQAGAVATLEALAEASRRGCLESVELFLEAGVNPMDLIWPSKRLSDDTAVSCACEHGNLECVEAFLPHLSRSDKQLALHWAVRYSRPAIVARLLQDPDVDANEIHEGLPPLIKSAFVGDTDSMEHLINAGADASLQITAVTYKSQYEKRFEASFPDSLTPLAAFCSKPPVDPQRGLSLLVGAGADVNARDQDGMTPLQHAKSFAVIEWLLDAGADPNSETDLGETMLHFCKDMDTLKLLVQVEGIDLNKRNLAGDPPLFSLVRRASDLALKFLEYEPDVKLRNNKGNGPLHVALLVTDYPETTHLLLTALLKAGADPNLRNSDGETPLHIFTSHRNYRFSKGLFVKVLHIFVQHGANLNARDSHGRTPVFRLVSLIAYFDSMNLAAHKRIDAFRKASADLTIPEYNGRTCLHEVALHYPATSYRQTTKLSTIVRCFSESGLSLMTVDLHGNTLLHELIKGIDGINCFPDTWDMLIQLGLDPHQPNNAGETPLHIACHRRQLHFLSDSLLQDSSNLINLPDLRGLRPIHHAASASEPFVERLLLAGADPFVLTVEQKNVLHIAARCRRSDNLRQLLSWMYKLDSKRTRISVNQKDASEYTPLHYACRSSMPESVRLLLEFGAEVEPYYTHKSQEHRQEPWFPPILQCVFSHQEQQLWKVPQQNDGILVAPGVFMDPRIPWSPPQTASARLAPLKFDLHTHAPRYEEIMQMLLHAQENQQVADCQWSKQVIIDAMEYAAQNGNDYATELVCQLYERTSGPRPLSLSVLMSKARRQAEKQLLCEPSRVKKGEANRDLVERCLIDHQYSAILEIYKAGADFKLSGNHDRPILSEFAQNGFAQLLDECSSPDDVALVGDGKEFGEYIYDFTEPKSLLAAACKTTFPNMAVLRVLVEKKNANYKNGGLHVLAMRRAWWQAAQGIPYLVSKGADLESQNGAGLTPLHVALNAKSRGAVEALLALGANANAVDKLHESCLTKARFDEDLTKLLISHGAKVDRETLNAAIRTSGQSTILEALLSADGASTLVQPMNRKLEDVARLDPSSKEAIEMRRCPVLFWVSDSGVSATQYMEALLKAGASPHETWLDSGDAVMQPSNDSPPVIAGRVWHQDGSAELKEKTVAHELLSRNAPFEPILEWKALELERRDGAGRTLFLASSHIASWGRWDSNVERIASISLLNLGADPSAVDNCGRNALHHLLGSDMPVEVKHATMLHMGRFVADLINKADTFGFYPLHYGLAYLLQPAEWSTHLEKPAAELIDYILSQGADTTIMDPCDNSLLHYLACGLAQHTKASRVIVSRVFAQLARSGQDVNARNKAAWTPMHCLMAYSNWRWSCEDTILRRVFDSIFDMLDELGVDWQAKDDMGRTVLHLAGQMSSKLFKKLMERGLDPWLEDAEGRTSLDMAAVYDNQGVLSMFGDGEDEDEEE